MLRDLLTRARAARHPKTSPSEVTPVAPLAIEPIDWSAEPCDPVWSDLEGAAERIAEIAARHGIDGGEAMLQKWLTDGYLVVDDVFPAADIDRFAEAVDDAWTAAEPFPDLRISDVTVRGTTHVHLAHADLLDLGEEERREAKQVSNWRIGEFHLVHPAARAVFDNPEVARICSMLLDRPSGATFSLTFSKGSQQQLHQDSCVFHTWPYNALVGVWVALEDISVDAGPLVYYPGSHAEGLYEGFGNYPQTQRRTSGPELSQAYDDHVATVAEGYERREFLARKGQALFWHASLIHGGSKHVLPGTTRKSFVIHCLPHGGNVGHRIAPPFNW